MPVLVGLALSPPLPRPCNSSVIPIVVVAGVGVNVGVLVGVGNGVLVGVGLVVGVAVGRLLIVRYAGIVVARTLVLVSVPATENTCVFGLKVRLAGWLLVAAFGVSVSVPTLVRV